jgi:murein L,D-transpeptidase YcbB/YkuD
MRRGVKTLEDAKGRDQLTWLLLRVIAKLSPCTTTSLIAHVSGGNAPRELGRAAPGSHTRNLILDALLKLEILDFIQTCEEQIVLTDKGRRCRDELAPPILQPHFAFLGALTLADYSPRLKRLCQNCFTAARLAGQRVLQMRDNRARRASGIAFQIWKCNAASMIESKATTLVVRLTPLWRLSCTYARAWGIVLGTWLRQTRGLSGMWAKDIRLPRNAKHTGPGWPIILGAAFSVVALSIAGGVTFLSDKSAESAGGGTTDWFVGWPDRSGSIADTSDPGSPRILITRTEAIGTAEPSKIDRRPAAMEPSSIEQHAGGLGTTPAATEQTTVDPIVATIRSKLALPTPHKGVPSEDLAALQSFYSERDGPALWMTDTGLTARAQAIISEIQNADAWGLSAATFDLPSTGSLPVTDDAQAGDEIKLGLAILQYARSARGGRLTPSRISNLVDQKPRLLKPKVVLTEISASDAPDAYLRSLNPKQEQFERLRQALLKAREQIEARGKRPANQRDIQLLIINMERWRWMPAELGSYYVWDNIPEFVARVVKQGKSIYVDKTIVGQPKYPTPIFSANMRSIVFNPEWTVPETIIKEDLKPALQQGGFFGGSSTAILEEHGLKVRYAGRPVDANSVDWANANIWQYTFTQAPGPDNVLGALKFNFPNKYAIYMHDTVQPELFAKSERTLSHGCIRVHEPDRLAALLLAEDKGWPAQQVQTMLETGNNSVVLLNRPVPVHLTYFTAVVGEQGNVQTFADVYGLDSKMGSALFGSATKINAPMLEVSAPGDQPKSSWRSAERTGGLTDSISGLFGN